MTEYRQIDSIPELRGLQRELAHYQDVVEHLSRNCSTLRAGLVLLVECFDGFAIPDEAEEENGDELDFSDPVLNQSMPFEHVIPRVRLARQLLKPPNTLKGEGK